MNSFIVHGELIDICEEFFIIKMDSQAEKKQKQADQQNNEEGSVMNRTTASMLSISSMSMIGSILSMEAEEGGQALDQFEDEWSQGFALRPTMIPIAYFPKSLAEKILFMGKAVRIL